MLKYILSVIYLLLIALCIILGILYTIQGSLVFYPQSPVGMEIPEKNFKGCKSPGEYSLEYEDVELKTSDGIILKGWFLKQKAKDSVTVLFFQGNAGNMGLRLPNLHQMYKHLNCNILAVSYRGYGHNTGKPTENGVYIDGVTMMEWLINHKFVNPNKIIVFGRSLGGAVAIEITKKYPHIVKGLIVENTFTSILDMSVIVFPLLNLLRPILKQICSIDMDNMRKLATRDLLDNNIPILFVSSDSDALIPRQQMKRLYNACVSSTKILLTIRGAGHTDAWAVSGPDYFNEIGQFVNNCLDGVKMESEIKSLYKSNPEPPTPIKVPWSSHRTLSTVAAQHVADTEWTATESTESTENVDLGNSPVKSSSTVLNPVEENAAETCISESRMVANDENDNATALNHRTPTTTSSE